MGLRLLALPCRVCIHCFETIDVALTQYSRKVLDLTSADGPAIDSPSLVADHGVYIMFFGSGCKTSTAYSTWYATATDITGPYTRAKTAFLETGTPFANLVAPGGLDVGPGGANVLFAADLGDTADTRQLYSGQITIDGAQVTFT